MNRAVVLTVILLCSLLTAGCSFTQRSEESVGTPLPVSGIPTPSPMTATSSAAGAPATGQLIDTITKDTDALEKDFDPQVYTDLPADL